MIKISVLAISTIMLLLSCNILNGEREAQRRNFNKQIGEYILDVEKTKLGKYAQDSLLYSNLKIVFREDSTFYMNMPVPFLYDTAGVWLAEGDGFESWNRLYYNNRKYENHDINTGNQFTEPWTRDSVFYINGATSRTEMEAIQEIYFKKIKKEN